MSDILSENVTNFMDIKDEEKGISTPLTNGTKVVDDNGGLPLMQVRAGNLHGLVFVHKLKNFLGLTFVPCYECILCRTRNNYAIRYNFCTSSCEAHVAGFKRCSGSRSESR
jgi:hypothetical protein